MRTPSLTQVALTAAFVAALGCGGVTSAVSNDAGADAPTAETGAPSDGPAGDTSGS